MAKGKREPVQEQLGPINSHERTMKTMFNHERQMERFQQQNMLHRNMTLEKHEPKK
jgi:hypothetical protein